MCWTITWILGLTAETTTNGSFLHGLVTLKRTVWNGLTIVQRWRKLVVVVVRTGLKVKNFRFLRKYCIPISHHSYTVSCVGQCKLAGTIFAP